MEQKMIEAITGLGSRIKMLFNNKHIEDKKLAKKSNENLLIIYKSIESLKKALENKTDEDVKNGLIDIETAISKMETTVNVEAPIVNIEAPEAKHLPAPENKETITMLKYILKSLRKKEGDGVFIKNSTPDAAVPVVLTERSRREFYDLGHQIIQAVSGGGEGRRLPLDEDGNVLTTPHNYSIEIERGNVNGQSNLRLSGANAVMQADVSEAIWDQGGAYTYLTADTQLYASSSNSADTSAITLLVFGLDDDYNKVTRTVILNGQNQVALSGLMFRVHQAFVSGSTDPQGDIYIAETDSLTAGVPNTATKIKAKIIQGSGSTKMGLFTVPAGSTLYGLNSAYLTKKDDDIVFTPFVRNLNGIFISTDIIPVYQRTALFDLTGLSVPEKADIEFRGVASNANSTGVIFVDAILIKN